MPNGHDTDLDNLILSYCYSARMPVELLRRDNVNEVLNMPHHNLTKAELVERLQRLVAKEWLQVSLRTSDALSPSEGVRVLAPMIDLARDAASDIHLSLTPTGGRMWEAFARPRWWAYISSEYADVINGRVHLIYRSPFRRPIDVLSDLIAYWTALRRPRHTMTKLDVWHPEDLPWKEFARGFELKIDTGTSPDTREGENYQSNSLSEVDGRLSDVVTHILSIWDVPFRFALKDLRVRLEQR
jgi:hypothetical protein